MPMLAARLCGIPVLMHEQNAIMGRSNRLLAGWAQLKLQTSWHDTSGLPQTANIRHTGLPVRAPLTALPDYQPHNSRHHILAAAHRVPIYLVSLCLKRLPPCRRRSANRYPSPIKYAQNRLKRPAHSIRMPACRQRLPASLMMCPKKWR